MGGSFLNVAQRDAAVEGGGDDSVAKRVRSDRLDDPGSASNAPDDASCAVPVEAPAVARGEDRPDRRSPTARSTAARCTRRKRDGHGPTALADDGEGPVAPLDTKDLDIGADRFVDIAVRAGLVPG